MIEQFEDITIVIPVQFLQDKGARESQNAKMMVMSSLL